MIFETVAVINGIPRHLEYHQQRLDHSRQVLGLTMPVPPLSELIVVPEEFRQGLVRCRIDFAQEVLAIKFANFKPAPVQLLIVAEADVSYEHKWTDRTCFDDLRALHSEYDDVLIARAGILTDSTMANLAFCRKGEWYTPEAPLLPGTARARLIAGGTLIPQEIRVDQLPGFESVVLVNALRGFNPEAAVSTARIAIAGMREAR